MAPKHYTYADYLEWNEGERVELIHGSVFAMTPAPSRIHQEVLGRMFTEFSLYLRGKSCRAYIAPFDVRLPRRNEQDEEIDTVVQPDLSIICDLKKLDEKGCKGAPDLIIEVISPSSLKLDMTTKKQLYEQVGVKEYWMVYPREKIVMVFIREESGKFSDGDTFGLEDVVPVQIFDSFHLELKHIFVNE